MSNLSKVISWIAIFMPILIACGRGIADAGLSDIALLFVVSSIIEKDWKWLDEKWIKVALILWSYTILRSFFVEDIIFSLSKTFPLIRFILFAACMQFVVSKNPDAVKKILISLTLTVGFLASDALFQYITGYDITGRPLHADEAGHVRLTGPYSKFVVGAVIAVLSAPVLSVIYFKIIKSTNIVQIISAALLAVAIYLAVFLSGERSAFLQITTAMLLIFACLNTNRKHILWLVAIACVAVGALIFFKPTILIERQFNSIIEIANNFPQSPYGMLWIAGIKAGLAHPIFGVGARYFELYCGQYSTFCAYHPHNIYIEWFAEFGLVGLAGFLYLFFVIFRKIISECCKLNYDQTRFLVVGIIISISIKLLPLPSSGFFKNWWAVPFWFMIGFVLCVLNHKNSKSKSNV
jgi:hypothetical protein